jgi:hypothetical protein
LPEKKRKKISVRFAPMQCASGGFFLFLFFKKEKKKISVRVALKQSMPAGGNCLRQFSYHLKNYFA